MTLWPTVEHQLRATLERPRGKIDSLAFGCSLPSREADEDTDWGGQRFSLGRLPRGGDAWAGS